jgi:hypothetical protein
MHTRIGATATAGSSAFALPSASGARPNAMNQRLHVPTLLVLVVLSACGGGGIGGGCGGGAPGLPAAPCPVTCTSWTNQVRPYLLGPDFLALAPDWSKSPPMADVKVAQRFRVTVGTVDLHPTDCNQGLDSPQLSYRSTDPAVVAVVGPALFEGVAPGTAHVMVDNLKKPSGSSESAELTVCSEANAPEITCPTRVPLVIRVIP